MKAIFQLIRWQNLVLIVLSQVFIVWNLYGIKQFTLPVIFYIICTFCFAASGNVINDIFDLIPDKINKPNKIIIGKRLTVKQSYIIYYSFNIVGLFCMVYTTIILKNYMFFACMTSVVILLYFYSKNLKGIIFLGNLIIALLTSSTLFFFLLIVPSSATQKSVIITFSLFVFLTNLIREIIKDIEDIKGDKNANLITLPILIGKKRATKIASIITYTTISCSIIILYTTQHLILKLYIIMFIMLPFIYIVSKLKRATIKKHYTHISNILKLIIVFGIFSILFV